MRCVIASNIVNIIILYKIRRACYTCASIEPCSPPSAEELTGGHHELVEDTEASSEVRCASRTGVKYGCSSAAFAVSLFS